MTSLGGDKRMSIKPIVATLVAAAAVVGLSTANAAYPSHHNHKAKAAASTCSAANTSDFFHMHSAQANKKAGCGRKLALSGQVYLDVKHYTEDGITSAATKLRSRDYLGVFGAVGADDITWMGVSHANIFADIAAGEQLNAHLNYHAAGGSDVELDEAYMNYNMGALSMHAGRQYVPFGHYSNPYPMWHGSSQAMTEVNQEIAGFSYDMGQFSALAWTGLNADGKFKYYGAGVGTEGHYGNYGYKAELTYINDIRMVKQYLIGSTTGNEQNAFDLGLKVHTGPFSVKASYTRAEKDSGTTPSVWGLGLGYAFDTAGYGSSVSLGYEKASDTETAEKTMSLAYTVDVTKSASVGFEYHRAEDYSGQGNKEDQDYFGVRVAMHF
jgi:hypothetical protein